MTIVLFAPDSIPLKDVAENLRHEGIVVSCISTDLQTLNDKSLKEKFEKGVIIFPHHGVAELTERVTELLTGKRILTLCIPQPNIMDRKLLFDCGASEIVTPQSWTAKHIAERILAQLILNGEIFPNRCGSMLGGTSIMRNLYDDIHTVAKLSDPILVLGETGTGKELVAKEVHRISNRPNKSVVINCAELNLELSGSDLFGHQKGSYTGAIQARKGLLAEAGNGTVFLDEIGELDLQAQAKLLRVIEDKQVRPVGSNLYEKIQARFILATNSNLVEECNKGNFRQDLYQRIKGFTLFLSPLRTRKSDIPLLAQYFLDEFNEEYKEKLVIPQGSLDSLFEYEWEGNIRELRAIIRKAAAYGNNGFMGLIRINEAANRSFQARTSNNAIQFDPKKDTWREVSNRAQSLYFQAILNETGQNKELAAKLSGLSRSQFYKKLDEIKVGSTN